MTAMSHKSCPEWPCTAADLKKKKEDSHDKLLLKNQRIVTRKLCNELSVSFNALETILVTFGYHLGWVGPTHVPTRKETRNACLSRDVERRKWQFHGIYHHRWLDAISSLQTGIKTNVCNDNVRFSHQSKKYKLQPSTGKVEGTILG